jgi:hypothetical protein
MENPDILTELSKEEVKFDIVNELMKKIRTMMIIKHCKEDNLPNEVIPGLFIGSIGSAMNKTILQELGITHILCVAEGIEPPYPNDFIYKQIKVLDSAEVSLAPHLESCFDFICFGLAAGKILVHW